MARILLLFVLFVTVRAAHKHRVHPKFPKVREVQDLEAPQMIQVPCSAENERIRNQIMEQSKCGPPKEVFEYLKAPSAHQQISPGAVWVKRCVGLCDSKCVAVEKQNRTIPVRIYNVKTNKESCMMYEIEEHLSCRCCASSPEHCESPRIYDARKCACRCPNRKEKRNCRSKGNQIMRWNPSKCACEERKRIR